MAMRIGSWAKVFALSVLIAGCASPPTPPDQFYRIYAEQPLASGGEPRLPGMLVVRRFLSDGLVGERSVVYTEAEHADPLFQYHYHHWTESPTRMLQEQLVPYLRAAGVAEEVVTPDLQVDARYELLGKIRRLEQIRGVAPQVLVELEFALTEPRPNELVWVQSYRAVVACEDDSPRAASVGFSRAITQIFAELVDDFSGE